MSGRGRRAPRGHRISVVAARYGIHPQTLRMYEREGLLEPSRSAGNTRLYDEGDLRDLEVILHLTRDLGVNLAGVEVVVNMRRTILRLRKDIERLQDLVHRGEEVGVSESTALIPSRWPRALQRLQRGGGARRGGAPIDSPDS